jgi:hypothetical protein
VGEAPQWMPLFTSPAWGEGQAMVLDDGPLHVGPGSLRLLMRCWLGPASAAVNAEISSDPKRRLEGGTLAGAVQLELVPQHVERAARADLQLALKPKQPPEAEGFVFSRLLLEASLSTDDVLLIVPERPDAEWRPRKMAEGEAAAGSPHGPPVPTEPTLGEVMLTDVASGGYRNTKVVIVVAPSPPRRFNLLAER